MAKYPQRRFSWGQGWCSGWCLESACKSDWLFWVKVVVSKPVLQRVFRACLNSHWTFSADVRAGVFKVGQGCETCRHVVEEAVPNKMGGFLFKR